MRVVARAPGPAITGVRHFWDPHSFQAESAFMDRKDLDNMYPTVKPRTTAGEYGYQRPNYWGCMLVPNPVVRLPHERRRLNPRPAKIVTVFGASGFLGAEIVRELLEYPNIEKVRATTRYPTLIPVGSDLDLLLQKYPDKLELHECDVTDRIQVNVAANGADTLIMAIDFHNEYANNSHFDVFVQGAQNVSWTARAVRAERVLFCNGLDATFASESNYVDMRVRAEEAFCANSPDATVFRFGTLYGTRYRYRGPGRYVYPAVFPSSIVSPTWVVDAARVVVRCTQASRAIRYKFDMGGPEQMPHIDFMRRLSALYHPRFVFPCPSSVGRFFAKLAPWVAPNPWFDDNWLLTYELDQINRRASMFDRLVSWDHIAYKPHTIDEAAAIDFRGAQLEPLHELDKVYLEDEKVDRRNLDEEEAAAARAGIHRAKAEPGYGRSEGIEALAQEIYPGQQFRARPLKGAKYPDTVRHPGPISAF